MSTSASNSTNIQIASGANPEQFSSEQPSRAQTNGERSNGERTNREQSNGEHYNRERFSRGRFNRGNRRNNHYQQRGGRSTHRVKNSDPREQTASSSQSSRAVGRARSNSNGDREQSSISTNEACFICREPVQYYAVSECNHKFCHLCSLRLRALYQNKNCAYCKTEQIKVIFTRDPDKEFKEFKESDIPYFDEKLNVYFEDSEMFEDITILLKLNCPDSKCEMSFERWGELKRHVKGDHHLYLCDICTRHKKIFAHEHSLFTHDKLDKHYREGDENTGFKGHPECQFCNTLFYGDDELYEHCRDKHEECFICLRAGIRHNYYRDYYLLEEHFEKEHYPCQNQECLEKKFVVFESDIDLKAHEVSTHGGNFGGQRAREARRIETNFNFGDSHTRGRGRGRGRRRSRERQLERQTDGDDDEITRQTQNLNLDSTTHAAYDVTVNARSVRPPPGFGVLSPDEVIGSADELLKNEMEIYNVASTSISIREEDFPSLRDAMKVTTSNVSDISKNYSEKLKKRADKPVQSVASSRDKPVQSVASSRDKPAQSVVSSSRGGPVPNSSQPPNITKGKSDFPPLPSVNQSTSVSSSSTGALNYRASFIDSEISSFNPAFYQRVSAFLSNNPAKIDEFRSWTTAYTDSILDTSSYIELLLPLFNKKMDIVGKVVSGLVETLEDEKKKTELLGAWQDYKAMRVAVSDFPALEPTTYGTITNLKPNIKTPSSNKSARVLVIKKSTAQSGGTKATNGPRVWDQIAAIAESKNKERNNSAYPSLAASVATTSTSSNNDVWRGSAPLFVQSPSRSEPTLYNSVNSSSATAFVRDRPTKAENEEFPGLPSTPKSQQRSKNNGPEKNAWGQGGALSSDNNQNENDSDDDPSVIAKEGAKKKKQKKQKTVLFRNY